MSYREKNIFRNHTHKKGSFLCKKKVFFLFTEIKLTNTRFFKTKRNLNTRNMLKEKTSIQKHHCSHSQSLKTETSTYGKVCQYLQCTAPPCLCFLGRTSFSAATQQLTQLQFSWITIQPSESQSLSSYFVLQSVPEHFH